MNKANQIYGLLKNENPANAIGILEAVKFNILMDTCKKTMEEIENESDDKDSQIAELKANFDAEDDENEKRIVELEEMVERREQRIVELEDEVRELRRP